MPTVLKTRKGQPPVEIGNVGIVDDKGIPLERCAPHMSELQAENGEPLTGAALIAAAEKWAETAGLDVSKPGAKPKSAAKGKGKSSPTVFPPLADKPDQPPADPNPANSAGDSSEVDHTPPPAVS